MPQNKRDKPGSLFSVDMACQAYSCLTWQGYGKSLFHFPDPVKKKEFYMTWLTNLNIEETSFTSTKHKLVCEDHFETSCFEGNLMVILFIFLIILTSVNTEMCCPKDKCGWQYFILLTLKKKKSWTQGSWIFLIKN